MFHRWITKPQLKTWFHPDLMSRLNFDSILTWCQGWILTSSWPDVKAEFWHHPVLMSRLNFDIILTFRMNSKHHPDLQDEFQTSSKAEFWHYPDLMSRLNFWMQQDIYWLWNVFFNDNIISGMYQQMQRSNQKVNLVENNDKGKIIYDQEPPSRESTTTECGLNYQLLAVIY